MLEHNKNNIMIKEIYMLIFFDIDGTLWDYKNYIPPSTKEAIKKARENGHRCFINTGRARAFVHNKELLGIGFDGIVSACGCMVEYDGKVLFNHLINREDSIRTLESVRRNRLKPILEGPEYLYMDIVDFEGDMYAGKVIEEMGDYLLSLSDNWGNWRMNKLSCDTTNSDREKCFEELDDLYSFMVHNEKVVEMVPRGFSKGTGIIEVCNLLGTDPSDTMAIGDSVNDKEMLETAGISIAMGRSSDLVKEICDHTTDFLENDGIMKALKKYDII